MICSLRTLFAFLAVAVAARAADSVLVFNEIQYHPANEVTQTEWVELRSLHGVNVDISGWRIEGGVDYTFPAGTIVNGNGYVVVAATPAQIPGAFGPFTGTLDNGGETLRLLNLNGRIMDEVSYDDEGDWPVGPDGNGTTLARRTSGARSGASAWSASAETGGTPGSQNFSTSTDTNSRVRAISIGDTWKFLDDGTTPAGNWNTVGFNDGAWKSGASLITGGGGALSKVTPANFPTGLISYWAFDEVSGTTAVNAANATFNGTMANGATFVADSIRGQVASFDGTDDRMEVINPGTGLPTLNLMPLLSAGQDFTWSAWVWSSLASTDAGQTSAVIVGNRTLPSGADSAPREFFKMMPTTTAYHVNAANNPQIDYPDLNTNTWTHMCVVKRGATFEYYRNGVFIQSATATAFQTLVQPIFVGGDRRTTNGPNEHFLGRVDDVGLWTRALSAGEISTLASGYGSATPTLPSPPEQTTNAVTGTGPRYFRKTFSFAGTPSNTNLELWPVADDGAVIYLNGAEIWRNNVPVTTQVGSAQFANAPVIIAGSALNSGTNVLSAEVHQFSGGNTDLLFGADLLTDETPQLAPDAAPKLVFSEISAASDAGFFIELQNKSTSSVDTAGWVLTTSAGASFTLPSVVVAPGGFASFTAASLGLTPTDGLRLSLFEPGGVKFRDARAITNRLRGLTSDGRWGHPTTATAGAANVVTVSDAIVINEIFYQGVNNSTEQWVELYNKSGGPVDVSLWKFSDGISYQFPAMTPQIPAGGYVVVAWDTAAFATLHPGVTAAGPFSGSLSGSGETITLRDANDNVADQVTYADGGRWSKWADGGGSSLELRDPDADNSKGEAWDASDETSRSTWQTVTYSGTAANSPSNNPAWWNEFIFGMVSEGEVLVDDISVRDVTQGNIELIQNGAFTGGTAASWRIIGNHVGSIVPDPTAPGNNVLKIAASGNSDPMHNQANTTLKNGASYHALVATDTYSVSFRAKWLRGSNRLRSHFYANRLPVQTLLNRPATGGTPGAVNSRAVANIGPTFDTLSHSPVVPAVSQAATVRIAVADPDGLTSVQLFTSINGAGFTSSAMTAGSGGIYTGTIGGQAADALVQFYVQATDSLGAVSTFPAAGAASRAIIPWQDGRSLAQLPSGARPHNVRVVMTTADATNLYKLENMMSNAEVPCTVIYDEKEVYYRAGVGLKSSEHGRFNVNRVGYNLSFANDELLHGIHSAAALDRSDAAGPGQKEMLVKRLSNLAGGIYTPEDDLVRMIPARGVTANGAHYDGSALLGASIFSKTRLKGDFLDNQWENGGDGMMFKYERIYVQSDTIDPNTRVVTGITTANVLSALSENPKTPQSTAPSPPGANVTNLGTLAGVDTKEIYRWHWLVETNRDTDDYSGILNVTNAVGQAAGATFDSLTSQHLDVSQWLRTFIPATLYGVVDNYLTVASSQHNVLVYFPPGKKAQLLPWDLDFLTQTTPTSSLTPNTDLVKFIANGANKRLYYGHMLDILNRSFNSATMTYWATHYSKFSSDDMTASVTNYLAPRAAYALNVVNGTGGQTAPIAPVAFARTSASPVSTSSPFTTVLGDGWINIAEIRLQGSAEPLAVTWTDDNSWSLSLPVSAGTNTYTLVAYDNAGTSLGTATVQVTGTGGVFPAGPGNLMVSELNYNPTGSSDLTEFIELLNITGATLDLTGCHFDLDPINGDGIAYTFGSVQIAPGARILVVRDQTAFTAQYGAGLPVAAGVFTDSLSNSGEEIVLYAASGLEILRFEYNDNDSTTDGGGKTLVRRISSTAPNPADYSWRPSTANNGNPGTTDALAFTGSAAADLDADGFPALVEYAYGTSDTDPNIRPPTIVLTVTPTTISASVTPPLSNADDAILTLEHVPSLGSTWSTYTIPVTNDAQHFFRQKAAQR